MTPLGRVGGASQWRQGVKIGMVRGMIGADGNGRGGGGGGGRGQELVDKLVLELIRREDGRIVLIVRRWLGVVGCAVARRAVL